MILALLLSALTMQSPAASPSLPAACSMAYGVHVNHSGRADYQVTRYQCDAGVPFAPFVLVTKAWFKSHCTKNGAGQGWKIASCDAWAPTDPINPKDAAGPSATKARMKGIGLAAAGVGFVVLCAYGGCGFAK